jgi:hypothetical protein
MKLLCLSEIKKKDGTVAFKAFQIYEFTPATDSDGRGLLMYKEGDYVFLMSDVLFTIEHFQVVDSTSGAEKE